MSSMNTTSYSLQKLTKDITFVLFHHQSAQEKCENVIKVISDLNFQCLFNDVYYNEKLSFEKYHLDVHCLNDSYEQSVVFDFSVSTLQSVCECFGCLSKR